MIQEYYDSPEATLDVFVGTRASARQGRGGMFEDAGPI